jgi:CDP-glycerol glycerophosphotransferase (TagB/SpsB family)
MITDVSSAIFDYLIFKKPVIIYMPDINEYLSGKRGVYPYFEGFLRGAAIKSWANLADQIVHVDKSDPLLDSISEQVFDKVNVCDAIHKDIIKRFM